MAGATGQPKAKHHGGQRTETEQPNCQRSAAKGIRFPTGEP
jgi:hypothetical protein